MNIRSIVTVFTFFIVTSLAFIASGEEGLSDNSAWMYNGQDTINSYTSKLPGDMFFEYTRTRDLFETDSGFFQGVTSTDIDGDGCADIIIRLNQTEIIAVSGKDNHVIFHLDGQETLSTDPLIIDLDGDDHLEMVVGYQKGELVWYDIDDGLEQMRNVQFNRQLSSYSQIMAMPSRNGTFDIVVADSVGTIHCLSHDGAVNWEVEYQKNWPRMIIIDEHYGEYMVYAATKNEHMSLDHMESDIVRIDGATGQVEKVMYFLYSIYSDFFYTKPSIIDVLGTKYIIIGGMDGYLIETNSLEIVQKISINNGLRACIPIPSETQPFVLLVGDGTIHLWDVIEGKIKGENYLPFPPNESMTFPVILCDMDGDTVLDIIVPHTHHIKVLNLTTGEEITRITWDKNYTRGKMPRPLFTDIDGDGFSELVYSCRLDTMHIQVYESPNVEFSLNTSLLDHGAILYPEVPRRIGFIITNLPSLNLITGGVLIVGDVDIFPILELKGGSCTVVQGRSNHLIDGLSIIASDHVIEYQFDLVIGWEIVTEELQDTVLSLWLDRRPVRNFTIPNVLRCENDLVFNGQMLVLNADGNPVEDGSWIHPTAALQMISGRVVFEGSGIAPVGQPYNVTMYTSDGFVFMHSIGDGTYSATIDLADFTDDLWTITIRIEDVPYNGSGLTPMSFQCRIDRIPPLIFLTNPDPCAWRAHNKLTVGFELFDNESGLDPDTIQISVTFNDTTVHLVEVFELSMLSSGHFRIVFVIDLQEGRNWLGLEVGDMVGNMNVTLPIPVNIDTSQIVFEDFTPTDWHNRTRVSVGITIIDNDGSGVDLSTIEYSYSVSGIFSYSEWLESGYDGTARTFTLSLDLDLEAGIENYVRFRARDVAGTEPRISDDYQVRIDTTPPRITIIDEVHNHLNTTVRFVLYDYPSGIDMESLAIVVASNGTNIDDITLDISDQDPGEYFVSIECRFLAYVLNEIHIHVLDHAVNGNASTFVIIINAPPILQIISPTNTSRHAVNSFIQFEALISDPDGDPLEVAWSLSNGTIINTSAIFEVQLEPGTYLITCRLTDGHEHVVIETLTIVVKDEPPPDRFSFIIDNPNLLLLIIVLIVVILTLAYYYRYRFLQKEA